MPMIRTERRSGQEATFWIALAVATALGCSSRPLSTSEQTPRPAPTPDSGSGSNPPEPGPAPAPVPGVTPIREIDVLVLVDNSPGVDTEQDALAKGFPALLRQLRAIPGGMPDTRLAVVTSDMGAGGNTVGENCLGYGDGARFQHRNSSSGENCGFQGDARYITASNQGSQTNLQPGKTIEDTFACMVRRGNRGCGYEHPLQAIRVALIPQVGLNIENANFLRPNAYLAILLLMDEDDCSAPPGQASYDFFVSDIKGQAPSLRCNTDGHLCNGRPISLDPSVSTPLSNCGPNPNPRRLIRVEDFIASIKALKRPDRIFVAGIFGLPQTGKEAAASYSVYANPRQVNDLEISPVCSTPGLGLADPGLRLKQFVDGFAPNSSAHSICNEDFTPLMDTIGKLLADRISK